MGGQDETDAARPAGGAGPVGSERAAGPGGKPAAHPSNGPAAQPASGPARRLVGRVGRARLAVITGAVVAAIVALSVVGATVGSGVGPPRTFGQAKNFTLRLLGHPGQHISLGSLAGRPVIVNFFAAWCTPCQKETPLLARFYRAQHGRVAIIGVDSNDSAAKARAFVAKSGVSYPVGVDPFPAATAVAYNVPGLPATFFLNARHTIVKRVYGAVTLPELTSGVAMMNAHGG